MSFVEINRDPTQRQLRQFGVIAFIVLPLIGWGWNAGTQTLLVLASVGAAAAAAGFLVPAFLRPVFIGLMILGAPIGIVVSEIIMLLIYFLVFLPIGLLMRLVGRDVLELTVDRKAETYWQARKQTTKPENYFRQS